MRAAISDALPALMHFYPGFKPWEIGSYTKVELENLLDALPDGR